MKWGNSMQEFAKILSNVEIAKDIWKMELKTDLAKRFNNRPIQKIMTVRFIILRNVACE